MVILHVCVNLVNAVKWRVKNEITVGHTVSLAHCIVGNSIIASVLCCVMHNQYRKFAHYVQYILNK